MMELEHNDDDALQDSINLVGCTDFDFSCYFKHCIMTHKGNHKLLANAFKPNVKEFVQ